MACSCGSSGRRSFSQIVASDGGSLPLLKYTHCKYKEQFESLFKQIGVNVNEGNLAGLAYAADKGLDRTGGLKDAQGKPIYFSVEEVLKKIDISQPSNDFCSV